MPLDLAGRAIGDWSAADADGDALVHSVLYSSDGGQRWVNAAIDRAGSTLPVAYDPAGLARRVRVLSSDVTHEWRAGEASPDPELVVAPPTPPPGGAAFALDVSGRLAGGAAAAGPGASRGEPVSGGKQASCRSSTSSCSRRS